MLQNDNPRKGFNELLAEAVGVSPLVRDQENVAGKDILAVAGVAPDVVGGAERAEDPAGELGKRGPGEIDHRKVIGLVALPADGVSSPIGDHQVRGLLILDPEKDLEGRMADPATRLKADPGIGPGEDLLPEDPSDRCGKLRDRGRRLIKMLPRIALAIVGVDRPAVGAVEPLPRFRPETAPDIDKLDLPSVPTLQRVQGLAKSLQTENVVGRIEVPAGMKLATPEPNIGKVSGRPKEIGQRREWDPELGPERALVAGQANPGPDRRTIGDDLIQAF